MGICMLKRDEVIMTGLYDAFVCGVMSSVPVLCVIGPCGGVWEVWVEFCWYG